MQLPKDVKFLYDMENGKPFSEEHTILGKKGDELFFFHYNGIDLEPILITRHKIIK